MILQKFSITGQHIERPNSLSLVSGSRNLIQFQFEFSAEWTGVNKTAVITTGGTLYNCIIDADGNISFRNMPVLAPGLCTVSVFGGDLFTTDSCAMTIYESGMKHGTTPTPPPPDIYSQITALADGANTNASAAKIAAEKAKTNAANALALANDTQNAAALAAKAAQTAQTKADADAAKTAADAVSTAADRTAAQKSATEAAAIVGGNYPTKAEAQGYADTARDAAKAASRPNTWMPTAADVGAVKRGDPVPFLSDRSGQPISFGAKLIGSNAYGSNHPRIEVLDDREKGTDASILVPYPTYPDDVANKGYVDSENTAIAMPYYAYDANNSPVSSGSLLLSKQYMGSSRWNCFLSGAVIPNPGAPNIKKVVVSTGDKNIGIYSSGDTVNCLALVGTGSNIYLRIKRMRGTFDGSLHELTLTVNDNEIWNAIIISSHLGNIY